jgi:biotin carboxyl carrier protein
MGLVKITSDMPATVWKVLVEVGQTVTTGQELLILESMKMEIPVECPCDGVVVVVHVAPEQPVEEGQMLAEVEPRP